MALGNGIPPELAALLGEGQGQPQGGSTPQAALLEAIQNAMGKRSMMAQPIMPVQGGPATDGEMYNAFKGFQSYAPDMIHPEDASGSPRDRYPASPRDNIDAGEGTYEQQPAEDKAARMAQDAVEGKGTKYPSNAGDASAADDEQKIMYDDAMAVMTRNGMSAKAFFDKYGTDYRDALDNFANTSQGTDDPSEPRRRR